MENFIKTIKDTPHERQFKVLLSSGRFILIYLRHPVRRSISGPQEPLWIYATGVSDVSLTYEDWQRFQFAINFISISVEGIKPVFQKIMDNPSENINVYS